jgi:hypothetical protein
MSPLRRVLVSLGVVLALGVLPTAASAAPRMYVSTARAADGTATAGGYAFDGMTQILDDFQLDVVRGGSTVATGAGHGFALVAPPSLLPGDDLVLTDTTTAQTRTATFTGRPTLTAPPCGTAAFSGTRDEGSTVDVSASLGDDHVPTVQVFGPGTTFSGAFAKALTAGWTVAASQARVIDPALTAFDVVSATVDATCPVVEAPTPEAPAPVVVATAPVAVAPAPVPAAAPGPVADTIAPLGRATIRKASSAYRSLLAGTFSVAVTVNEPATIKQSLLVGKRTLATASRKVAKAGTVTLTFKLSKTSRRRLTSASSTRLTLATTLRDPAGNARTLPARRFTARRAR